MKEFKLDAKKKKVWVKALRSGKLKQGWGCLFDAYENNYCCLGVARECKLTKRNKNHQGMVAFNFLPEIVQNDLIQLNDVKCKSFKYIANYIEKNL